MRMNIKPKLLTDTGESIFEEKAMQETGRSRLVKRIEAGRRLLWL